MTAYCFVGSPGFSNRTCILGALPLGTASEGDTYSLCSCEYAITAAIPINPNTQPISFSLITALPSDVPASLHLTRLAQHRPPIAVGNHMSIFFHLQNHGRKIMLRSLVGLSRIDLKSSSRGGHSCSHGGREIENQSEILVHQTNGKLRAVVAPHRSFQFAGMRRCNDRSF